MHANSILSDSPLLSGYMVRTFVILGGHRCCYAKIDYVLAFTQLHAHSYVLVCTSSCQAIGQKQQLALPPAPIPSPK